MRLLGNVDLFLFIHSAEHKEDTKDHCHHAGYDGKNKVRAADIISLLTHVHPNLPNSQSGEYQSAKNTKHIFHKVIALRVIKDLIAFVDHCQAAANRNEL
jgi:hypothetical protein